MDPIRANLSIMILGLLLSGCSNNTEAPTQKPDTVAADFNVPSTDAPSTQGFASLQSGEAVDDVVPESGQEVIQAMQNRLQASIATNGGKEPAPEEVEATIAFGKIQRDRFPDDDNLTQALTAMMFQSVRFLENDPTKLVERRLELGQMARLLIAKQDVASQLGNMPSFLLLEEAKGLIQKGELQQGWQTIVESRAHGFRQSKLLFLDPAFEAVVGQEDYAKEIQTWLTDELTQQIAQQEAFPFSFALKSLDEERTEVSLDDFADKKLILIDTWGTWCSPCRAAVPHLVAVQEKFKDQLAVVGVNFEQPIGGASIEDTKARLEEFRASQPINYPCLYGDFDPRAKIPGFEGFPTMLLVDNKGRTRLLISGYQPLPVLETTIRQVLKSLKE